jgi:hypothetical protein
MPSQCNNETAYTLPILIHLKWKRKRFRGVIAQLCSEPSINCLTARPLNVFYLQASAYHGPTVEDPMSRANLKESLFWLSKWAAFILGCGSLFADGAQASKSQIQPIGAVGPSNSLGLNSDQVLIRLEGEKIYISQDGSTFRELSLVDAPETTYFKALLRDANTAEIAVPVGPIIVANGGSGANGAKSKDAKKKKEQKETPTNAPPAGK